MKLQKLCEYERDYHALQNAAQQIFENCSEFLTAIDYKIERHVLWRGLSSRNVPDIFELFLLQDRERARDTPRVIHDEVNNWFIQEYGIPYRTEAIFCTGSKKMALEYSRSVGAIIPYNGYEFIYSNTIKDLYHSIEFNSPLLSMVNSKEYTYLELNREVDILLHSGEYSNTNIVDAIQSDAEIMLHSDKYYIVNPDVLLDIRQLFARIKE